MTLVTESNFQKALAVLHGQRRLVVDTETTGLRVWHGDRVCGYVIGTPDLQHKFYFPFRHEDGENLKSRHLRAVVELLNDKSKVHTGWNYKFDLHMMSHDGVDLWDTKIEDVMLAAHLCNENERTYQLKELGEKYVGEGVRQAELDLIHLLADRGLGKGNMWRLRPEEVEPYACQDLELTEQMRRLTYRGLKDWGLLEIWREVNEYLKVNAKMERRGLKLDVDLIKEYQNEAAIKLRRTKKKLEKYAGYPINPNSPKQLQAWLDLETTAKDVLEDILSIHADRDDVRTLLEYRGWAKVDSSYYSVYLNKMDEDEILHPNIKLHGTVAGRPSAEDPNLQAVPRYSPVYKVKDVFTARPGYVLISADYSQAEVRMGAWYTKDEALLALLKAGGDIHGATGADLKIPRDAAKRIIFGIFYGLGAPGLAQRLRIPESLAQEYLDAFHRKHVRIKPFYYNMQRKARMHDYIRLWTGRCRRYNVPWAEHRKALSNLIQGGVAEMMRHAMCTIDDRFKHDPRLEDSHILMQIHDQIITETPERLLKRTARAMQEHMLDNRFGMKVDFKAGPRWGTMDTLEL